MSTNYRAVIVIDCVTGDCSLEQGFGSPEGEARRRFRDLQEVKAIALNTLINEHQLDTEVSERAGSGAISSFPGSACWMVTSLGDRE